MIHNFRSRLNVLIPWAFFYCRDMSIAKYNSFYQRAVLRNLYRWKWQSRYYLLRKNYVEVNNSFKYTAFQVPGFDLLGVFLYTKDKPTKQSQFENHATSSNKNISSLTSLVVTRNAFPAAKIHKEGFWTQPTQRRRKDAVKTS